MQCPEFQAQLSLLATHTEVGLTCTIPECGHTLDADLDKTLDRTGQHVACHGCGVVHRIPDVRDLTAPAAA